LCGSEIVIYIADTFGSSIDAASIELGLLLRDKLGYRSFGQPCYINRGHMTVIPSPLYSHGDTVRLTLVSFSNVSGCEGDSITCSFIVDLRPPALILLIPQTVPRYYTIAITAF
jgi:hypothetical protein